MRWQWQCESRSSINKSFFGRSNARGLHRVGGTAGSDCDESPYCPLLPIVQHGGRCKVVDDDKVKDTLKLGASWFPLAQRIWHINPIGWGFMVQGFMGLQKQ